MTISTQRMLTRLLALPDAARLEILDFLGALPRDEDETEALIKAFERGLENRAAIRNAAG